MNEDAIRNAVKVFRALPTMEAHCALYLMREEMERRDTEAKPKRGRPKGSGKRVQNQPPAVVTYEGER